MTGAGGWEQALLQAQSLVSQMILEEKVSLTGGSRNSTSKYGGNIPAISRLGFPGMCLQDGPSGVRGTELVNGYPSGIHLGASWNTNLTYLQAHAIAGEFKRKGATMPLGPPVIGPLGRIALGGRIWEGYSNDPYLSGILGAEAVRGVQDNGVISCAKHFVGNEQELHRNQLTEPLTNRTIETSSSNIDNRTMHELYVWPFADAIHAGAASIMCAYQRLNNSYSCHNSKALNGLVKTELNFQGFVVSDWGAQHAGIASAMAGLDMVMPYGDEYWGANLTKAVHNGSIPESRITNMATKIMASWYFSHMDDPGLPSVGVGLTSEFEKPHQVIDARDPDNANLLLEAAIQGHVLVKNVGNALPLTRPRIVSLYGYDAKSPDTNVAKSGMNGCSPFQALEARARRERTQLFWDFEGTEAVNSETDACLVFINAPASEGVDRPALRDDYSDGLILNAKTREAITKLLYGDVSPSGKLPYRLPRNESDYGSLLAPVTSKNGDWDQYFPQDDFTEGFFIDYRAFDKNGITPRFEFGFGMTYTTFEYSNLRIRHTINSSNLSEYPVGGLIPGGSADLWDAVVDFTADITNTGWTEAAEVAQLYLRGFDKVTIPPGETRAVRFSLRRRDLSIWDAVAQKWKLAIGSEYPVFVGASSRNLILKDTLVL
ncbi:hypothetical protein BDV12DRAFT_187361 [Aspergillus spectabilis]